MREIKFRAWDKRRKRWADHIEVYEDGTFNIAYGLEGGGIVRAEWEDGVDMDILGSDSFGKWNYERDCVLMQFTGLHDKNGREVYEGDIVRYTYRLSNNAPDLFLEYLIKWDDKNFKFNKFFKKDDGGWEADIFTGLWFEGTRSMYEVIGNIYENPELLKEGETK